MCGLFAIVGDYGNREEHLDVLIRASEIRGKDSSGLIQVSSSGYSVDRGDFKMSILQNRVGRLSGEVVAGHSRLMTSGHFDNQPVVRDDITVLHNGILLNESEVWKSINQKPLLEIDTEVIAAVFQQEIERGKTPENAGLEVLQVCRGTINCLIFVPRLSALVLISNHGSLYMGLVEGAAVIASEEWPLRKIGARSISNIRGASSIAIPTNSGCPTLKDYRVQRTTLLPELTSNSTLERELRGYESDLLRCSRCILPETMPFITFNAEGVCNFCLNHRVLKPKKSLKDFSEMVDRYGKNVIFPFSGGRDSSYGLHLAVRELGLKPIAYTYDWGMVTDVGRRNISRMLSELEVEHYVVAANIEKKRSNIKRNIEAWLSKPHLGMVNLFTAGDKHFFQFLRQVQTRTGVSFNLWSFNPLEVTHFKTGFLGLPPSHDSDKVFLTGIRTQLRYQSLRAAQVARNPAYLNRSVWDTLTGEYYRSVVKLRHYSQLFDYVEWKEETVDEVLRSYSWETAEDTTTTWRIGDGTAAFYNYIFFRVAGFTEHDTLRSNQIREGHLSRDEALELAQMENRPRFQNLKWYLDAVGLDFSETIQRINSIPQIRG